MAIQNTVERVTVIVTVLVRVNLLLVINLKCQTSEVRSLHSASDVQDYWNQLT